MPDQTLPIAVHNVLCFEYLHAVPEAWAEADLSLRTEAAAMLKAVLQDLKTIASVQLTTLLGRSPGTPAATVVTITAEDSVEIVDVSSGVHLRDLLADFAARGFQILMIAPECDGILSQLTGLVESSAASRSQLLSPSRQLIDIFSDKLATCDWLLAGNLPTIPTCDLHHWLKDKTALPASYQVIIKPRDGVGSHNVRRLNTDDQQSIQRLVASITETAAFIVQPFVEGTACSIGFIGTRNPGQAIVLKPVLQ